MTPLEVLTIGIEADTNAAKVAITNFVNFAVDSVGKLNRQEVTWTQILSKSITPALIASIAGTFALAITQALQFQNAVQQASLNSTTSFKNTTGAITQGAFDISTATGQSAVDIETAMKAVNAVYKNGSDAQLVAANLATFSAAEHTSLADAVAQALPLLQNWNISAEDSAKVLAVLGQSTSFGKLSIQQLSSALTDAGPAISKLIDLPSAIAQLQEASTVKGFTPDAILNYFDVIVKGASKAAPQVNAIFGDMGNAISTGGFGKALDMIQDRLQQLGPIAAQSVGASVGLTSKAITEDLNNVRDSFIEIGKLAQGFLSVVKPLQQWWEDNKTKVDELKIAWAELVQKLNEFVAPAAFTIFAGLLHALTGDAMLFGALMDKLGQSKDFIGSFIKNPGSTIKDTLAGLGFTSFGTSANDYGIVQPSNATHNGTQQDQANNTASQGGRVINVITTINSPTGDPNIAANKANSSLLQTINNDIHL